MKIIVRHRDLDALSKLMKIFRVVAILGPRQCGKTTLARAIGADHYFDLENRRMLPFWISLSLRSNISQV